MVRPWQTSAGPIVRSGVGVMKRSSVTWAVIAAGLLSGCMVDLYGGNPRIQVSNEAPRWRIRSVGLGDTASPLWRESFDPLIHSGATTRVMDVPVAGTLKGFLELRDSLDRDSLARIQLRLDDGAFQKWEMSEDSMGRLRIEELR